MLVRKRNRGWNLSWFFKELCKISDVLSVHPGVAVPEGEAHRHEPPIPHDEVKVDTRKNNAELEEDKKQPLAPAGGGEEEPRRDNEHVVEVDDQKEAKDEEKLKPVEAVVRKEEVDLGGGEVLSNEVLDKPAGEAGKKWEEGEKLDPVKDAGNAADAAANQAAVEQVDKVDKAADAAGKREYLLLFLCNYITSQKKKMQH